ncbi:uncharacterized protein TRIADDRAFT_51765 [Trichoplax adhaerens]|uniref:Uncharacterized protein n=1 Tax=Trichoplax adhaerens TaxID=10228 RepID=B3RKU1_TRIAD|nr:predicted protein [Trichoplax adhaerens]EDV28644.1 predicted protein [Trichoplax adhaerens]|eukprot:XP_002107846.1 predicted protein [Trichoplax adhaerens]
MRIAKNLIRIDLQQGKDYFMINAFLSRPFICSKFKFEDNVCNNGSTKPKIDERLDYFNMSIPLYEKRNANSLSINGFPSTYTTDSQDDCSTVAVTPIARRKVMKHASGSYSPSYHHNLSLSLYEYDELKYFRPLIHDRCPPSIEKGNIMKYDLIGVRTFDAVAKILP